MIAMLTMFDNIDTAAIPAGQNALGYVDGRWPNYGTLAAQGRPHVLSMAVFAQDDAESLDIENGDATPTDAPGWVRRQLARGVWRPVLYASVNTMPQVLAALNAAGIPRTAVRLLTAHYSYTAHLCDHGCEPAFTDTADGTQWTDRAAGGCDQSLLNDGFFEPPITPPDFTEVHMFIAVQKDNIPASGAPQYLIGDNLTKIHLGDPSDLDDLYKRLGSAVPMSQADLALIPDVAQGSA